MSELRPCPNLWCKRNDVAVHGPDMVSDTYCVGCECGIGGPECATESEAVAAWNYRPVEDALAKAKKLAKWTTITPHNLPKVGWEVGRTSANDPLGPYNVRDVREVSQELADTCRDMATWIFYNYQVARPINPPQPEKPSTTD